MTTTPRNGRSVRGTVPLGTVPLAVAVALLAACSSRAEAQASRERGAARAGATAAPQPFDFGHPLSALSIDADAAAGRLGSFSWEAQVTWSVSRPGATPIHQSERHQVRQLVGGDFSARADLDPGGGTAAARPPDPGTPDAGTPDAGAPAMSPVSPTGRQVVYVGRKTYARSRWAPFRERPTDRGHGARRFRDQSFQLAADLTSLYGPALSARAAGEATVHGRRARRFVLSLSGAPPGARATAERPPPGGYDADTKRRLAFLDGRVPTEAEGELLLDAESGVPLAVRLKGAFSEKDDPQLRAEFELRTRIDALGRAVAAVEAPAGALPDERKPKGVAQALEAAGLRKRAESAAPAQEEDEEP